MANKLKLHYQRKTAGESNLIIKDSVSFIFRKIDVVNRFCKHRTIMSNTNLL